MLTRSRIFPLFFLLAIAAHVRAQEDMAKVQQALGAISRFANEICTSIDASSSSSSVEVSGEAKAKLDTLVSKIVDLGIGGSAKYTQAQGKGVLQKDLAQAFKDANTCRLQVLESLKDRLLPIANPDPQAGKFAGLWFNTGDRSTSYSVTVRGDKFHSIEFGRSGLTLSSIDGVVSNGTMEGSWYVEPAGFMIQGKPLLTERRLAGRVLLRLTADEQRLSGTLTTSGEKQMTIKMDWSR